MKNRLRAGVLVAALTTSCFMASGQAANDAEQPVGVAHVYKTVAGRELHAYVSSPKDNLATHPAIVFFHGGGWTGGTITQFNMQSQELAARGMVAVDIEYRLVAKAPSLESPVICLQDAKSAMRWVRTHAAELHIDPNRIVASGGSAGGYLAAAVAMVEDGNDPSDDLKISVKPQALVLFFPVVDLSPEGYGNARFGETWERYSPNLFLSPKSPPTIIEAGAADKLVRPETLKAYQARCTAVGARCELHFYDGQGHGFANNEPYRSLTLNEVIHFLKSIAYLSADATDVAVPAAPAR